MAKEKLTSCSSVRWWEETSTTWNRTKELTASVDWGAFLGVQLQKRHRAQLLWIIHLHASPSKCSVQISYGSPSGHGLLLVPCIRQTEGLLNLLLLVPAQGFPDSFSIEKLGEHAFGRPAWSSPPEAMALEALQPLACSNRPTQACGLGCKEPLRVPLLHKVNIHQERLLLLLQQLGKPPSMARWCSRKIGHHQVKGKKMRLASGGGISEESQGKIPELNMLF